MAVLLLRQLAALALAPPRARPLRAAAAASGTFELELLSPARVHLFLRLSARGDDGLHDCASLFQTLDFGDRLRLARIPGDPVAAAGVVRPSRKSEPIKQNVEFSVSPAGIPDLPDDQTNSVVRALTLYRRKLTERDGGSFAVPRFRAHLVKSLPLDAGLGGASSNAAAALVGANELCGGLASSDELRSWADELGADVAAFVGGTGSAYCTGRAIFVRGDAVEPLPPLAGPAAGELFVVAPQIELSTPALFRHLQADEYRGLGATPPQALLDEFRSGASAFANDLEDAALAVSKPLAAVRSRLLDSEGFRAVALSGAGPALLAVGPPQAGEGADAFAARFRDECAAELGVDVGVWPAQFGAGPR